MLQHSLKVIPLILASVFGSCQVEVTVPASTFKAFEKISARVANLGSQHISYCVEFGQSSFKGKGDEHAEATPTPFYVQQKSGKKWDTLLNGPDVGSFRSSVVLEPGESQEFPFRLNSKGTMRLILDYWMGEKDMNCKKPPGGRKEARSIAFAVQ